MVEKINEEIYRGSITNYLLYMREQIIRLCGVDDANSIMEDALANFAWNI